MLPWAAGWKSKYYWRLAAPATWEAQYAEIIREPRSWWLRPLLPEGQTGKQQIGFRATAVHCKASPSGPGDGEHGPKLTECVGPQTSLWTLNSPVLWVRKVQKSFIEPDLVLPTVVGGTYKTHQATLLVTSVGTKCSSVFSSAFHSTHWTVPLCSAHTIRILRATKLMGTFTCISFLEENHERGHILWWDIS